jgi:hypothetical protein
MLPEIRHAKIREYRCEVGRLRRGEIRGRGREPRAQQDRLRAA